MAAQRPLIANSAKQALKEGRALFGFGVFECMRPAIVKIAAHAGFDVLLVECEHVLHNEETLTSFIVAARDNALPVIVSVPTVERHFISRLLDAGALGIMLPHAETAEQVAQLVRWTKYPPIGERAVVFGANTDYRLVDVARYCEEANVATLLMLKIESRKGIEQAETLLANPWVDALCFGPVDLSADMGLHGQTEHPDLLAAAAQVTGLALRRGVAVAAMSTPDRAAYERQRAQGIQIFGTASELDLMREAALQFLERFR